MIFMRHRINSIRQQTLEEHFKVDVSTGTLHRTKATRRDFLGPVGHDNGQGYLRLCFQGSLFLVHQIVWRLVHGKVIPIGKVVDHINGDPGDNRPSNLRAVSQSRNKLNAGPYRTNTTGKRGVTFNKGKGKYEVTITVDQDRVWIGQYDTVQKAVLARELAEGVYGVA